MEKRRNCSTMLSIYISNFRSQITISFEKCGCSTHCFRNSSNLIYRGADISKYFKESLEFLDKENRLH